jgi:hypothetical protein
LWFNPDSAVKPKMPAARQSPGAAKASDSDVSKAFLALASCCDQAQHPLAVPPIDVCSRGSNPSTCCGRVAPRTFWRSQLRNPGLIYKKPGSLSRYLLRRSWNQSQCEQSAHPGFLSFRFVVCLPLRIQPLILSSVYNLYIVAHSFKRVCKHNTAGGWLALRVPAF